MRRRKQTEAFSLFSFQDIITSVTGILVLLTLFLALQLVQPKSFDTAASEAAPDVNLKRSVAQIDAQIAQLRQSLDSGHRFLNEFAALSPSSLAQEEEQLKQSIARFRSEMPHLRSDIAAIQREPEKPDTVSRDELAALNRKIASLNQQIESLKATNRIVYNVAPGVKKAAWLVDLSPDSISVAKPGVKNSLVKFEGVPNGTLPEQFLSWTKSRDPNSDYFVLLVRPKSLALYRQIYERLNDTGFAIGVDLLERDATLVDFSQILGTKL